MKDNSLKYKQAGYSEKHNPNRWLRKFERDLSKLNKVLASDELVRYNMISDQQHEDVQYDRDLEEYLRNKSL